jgi:hypothetical protein
LFFCHLFAFGFVILDLRYHLCYHFCVVLSFLCHFCVDDRTTKERAKNCAEVKRMERRLLCKQQAENKRIQTWTQENQELDNDHQVAVKEETGKTHEKQC